MNSLFEHLAPGPDLPGGMVSDLLTRGNRGVSALNFVAVRSAADLEEMEEADGGGQAPDAVDERAQQIAVMVDAAREDAAEQARLEMQGQWEIQQERERARAEQLAVEFARDRRRYFAAAETQVVRLALAVASSILAREVKMNQLPLATAVQKALTRMQDDSQTDLRVGPEQAASWSRMFENEPRVRVTEDAALGADDCILETRIGRIELGVAAQMQEIERGFEDLLERTGD